MANIAHKRKTLIGKVRTILNNLKCLNLQKYYFEAGVIFLKTMLRPSILYGCETYYNLIEKEIRIFVQIEEGYLIKLLNTLRSCPRFQLYTECGLYPIRFEIIISNIFLTKIVNQPF